MTQPAVSQPIPGPNPDLAIAAQPLTPERLREALRMGICLPCPVCSGGDARHECRACLGSGFVRPCHACHTTGFRRGGGATCLVCAGHGHTAGDPPSAEDDAPVAFGRPDIGERQLRLAGRTMRA